MLFRSALLPIPHNITRLQCPPSLIGAPSLFPMLQNIPKTRETHLHQPSLTKLQSPELFARYYYLDRKDFNIENWLCEQNRAFEKSSNPKPPSGGIFLAVMQMEWRSSTPGPQCPLADTKYRVGSVPRERGEGGTARPRQRCTRGSALQRKGSVCVSYVCGWI